MIGEWLLSRWARWGALIVAVLAAIGLMRRDAAQDALRDKEQEDKEADDDRADEIRRRVDAARAGGGLHPDDRRGYRD